MSRPKLADRLHRRMLMYVVREEYRNACRLRDRMTRRGFRVLPIGTDGPGATYLKNLELSNKVFGACDELI